MKLNFSEWRNHILVIVFFVLLSVIYFSPAVFDGKKLPQGDIKQAKGMAQETNAYADSEKSEGEVVAWTGAMFSGMPTYHTTVRNAPENYLRYLERPFKSVDYMGASILLVAFISFYILMCVMGVNVWVAVFGSVAFTLASYNVIIIAAGHITKAYVIAYMPLTIAGMWLLFKSRLLMGGMLFCLGITLSLMNSHVQITYYLAIFCAIVFLGYAVKEIRGGEYKQLLKVVGVSAVAVLLAILPNLGRLYADNEMSKESLRGKSELTHTTEGKKQEISSGLDMDYAFRWSYGKGETMTLLIPDFYGGASGGTVGLDSELAREYRAHGGNVSEEIQTYTYWGNQPFTSGPVYFGAIVCFLFLLGMMVVRSKMKWWILGATIFFFILSWGNNFGLNEFLFHNLPLYNKFRTPSMALVIPGLTFPLMAAWGLCEIFRGRTDKEKLRKYLLYSGGITGGLCLLFWMLPGAFLDFSSPIDSQIGAPEWYIQALMSDRASLLRSDALRSFIYIALAFGLLWMYMKKESVKMMNYAVIGILFLTLVDLWSVDKRYLNNSDFKTASSVNTFTMTAADRAIKRDTDPSYRVLSLGDPFNETSISYFHKSIGGYSAAKLRRYQELIDHRIDGEMDLIMDSLKSKSENPLAVFEYTPTLNMLNMRYLIYNTNAAPLRNPYAYGNAWFVEDIRIVENADEEIRALNEIDPMHTAVVDKRFAEVSGMTANAVDTMSSIVLTEYKPVKLTYKTRTDIEQTAVFSEIYYAHGWKAYIDGKPADHFRADWVLRGMKIPAGEHTVVFEFEPDGYITASRISSMASLFILLLLVGVVGWSFYKSRKKAEEASV